MAAVKVDMHKRNGHMVGKHGATMDGGDKEPLVSNLKRFYGLNEGAKQQKHTQNEYFVVPYSDIAAQESYATAIALSRSCNASVGYW
ncbi:unnamed protein product [Malus baccata var. baccata]